ncbi:hypothetical protein SprV_0200858600 [Sparganum proliferum]
MLKDCAYDYGRIAYHQRQRSFGGGMRQRGSIGQGSPDSFKSSQCLINKLEAVLQRLESLVFRHHRPKFWARCVDGIFVVIERDQMLEFKEHFNAIFPDIQFTMEEEENQLAFLDALVCRKDCGGL